MKLKIACSLSCHKKKQFQTRKEAIERSEQINKENKGVNLRVYPCNKCKKFHLTSKTKKESSEIRKAIAEKQRKHNQQYEASIQKEADYWIKKKGWT